jgi:transposase
MHCEKMAVTDMSFRQGAGIEFLVKEGNSAVVIYELLRGVYGDVYMGVSSVRRWVKHFKDGNTDIADQPRCGRQRTAATQHNKQKVDELIRQDRRITEKLQRSLEWGTMRSRRRWIFGISENLFPLGSPFAYGYRGTQNGWKLLSHPPYNPDLASSDYHLFGPMKDHVNGHHYETDEAVQEATRSWLRGAGTDFYSRGIFNLLQRWQKCIDQDGLCRKNNKRCLGFTDNIYLYVYLRLLVG